jgi:zinc protease
MGERRWSKWLGAGALAIAVSTVACGGVRVRAVSKVKSQLPLEVHRHTLANGLEVLMQEDHHTPFVAIDVGYRVGGRDDPDKRSGLAHLFEHLMFEGSKHVTPGDHSTLLAKAGATVANATTSDDHTHYFETVPSKHLELALWLESDRMGFLTEALYEKKLAKQRAIVKNERRQRYENVAYGLVHDAVRAAMYPEGHPYHRYTIGTHADLDAITLDEAKSFFNRYYVPDNATLVLVGDFDEQLALRMIKSYFEPIPRGPAPLAHWPQMPVSLAKDVTVTMEADVEAPRLVFAWPMPPRYSPRYWDVVVASQFAAGNIRNELTTTDPDNMTDPSRVAHTVHEWYDAEELAGTLFIDVTLHPGKDPVKARAAIDDVLVHMGRYRSFERNSVYRTGTENAASLVFALEDLGQRADVFGWDAQATGDPLFIKNVLQNFDALDPDDCSDAFKEEILRKSGVVAIVTPKAGAPKGGKVVSVQ